MTEQTTPEPDDATGHAQTWRAMPDLPAPAAPEPAALDDDDVEGHGRKFRL